MVIEKRKECDEEVEGYLSMKNCGLTSFVMRLKWSMNGACLKRKRVRISFSWLCVRKRRQPSSTRDLMQGG